ncbi:MAG: cupin domain-containing protein [Holophagales bacterium]|nr:cupin domain-containing protein [Holophagales bacterium]
MPPDSPNAAPALGTEAVDLRDKLRRFHDLWSPRIVAELNGQYVKLAKVKGEFVWHDHAEEDELFLVLHGHLVLRLRDREIHLREGQLFVVPRGVEHQPYAQEETHLLLFEPKKTSHSGGVESPLAVAVEDQLPI